MTRLKSDHPPPSHNSNGAPPPSPPWRDGFGIKDLVSWGLIRWSWLNLCSVTADLLGCPSRMSPECSTLVSMVRPVCPIYTSPHSRHSRSLQPQVVLRGTEEVFLLNRPYVVSIYGMRATDVVLSLDIEVIAAGLEAHRIQFWLNPSPLEVVLGLSNSPCKISLSHKVLALNIKVARTDYLPEGWWCEPGCHQRFVWGRFGYILWPRHFLIAVPHFLITKFTWKWTVIAWPITWPPRSPDLKLLDFFFWAYTQHGLCVPPCPSPCWNLLEECTLQKLQCSRRAYKCIVRTDAIGERLLNVCKVLSAADNNHSAFRFHSYATCYLHSITLQSTTFHVFTHDYFFRLCGDKTTRGNVLVRITWHWGAFA